MKKTLRLLIFLLAITLFLFISSIGVYAWVEYHVNIFWCVDSGKHLDWSGSTRYSSYWETGINTWNNHRSGVIRKDTILTINDATIQDVDDLSGDVVAQTHTNYPTGGGKGTCNIYFSITKMNICTDIQKTIVCTHEIGHALGLDENNSSVYNVMYQHMLSNQSNNVLSPADKNNYDYMYYNKY